MALDPGRARLVRFGDTRFYRARIGEPIRDATPPNRHSVLAAPLRVRPGPRRPTPVKVGERVERRGDEIVVCGQLFHTTAPVKLWTDPGGYDAYRLDHRFGPVGEPPRGEDSEMPKPLRRFGDAEGRA